MKYSLLALLFFLGACSSKNYGDELYRLQMASHGKDVMWVPTKLDIAHQMLKMAEVTESDIVYDLGSGDGVISIEAARAFGARAFGIEYNPDLVALSQRNAIRSGVSERASFRRGDIFVEDFSAATVLTLYLGENLNARLMPKILDMRPGTRVVSNTFRMDTWIPDQEMRFNSGEVAFLWIVPAKADGIWEIRGDSSRLAAKLRIRQKKQFFDATFEFAGQRGTAIENGKITGDQITFEFRDEQKKRNHFIGTIDGPLITGSLNGEVKISGVRLSN
jgi:precorrin-6B methylase 2